MKKRSFTKEIASSPERADLLSSPMAVIDIGSTGIRLEIAQISPQGEILPVESLSQEVSLGKDSFTRNVIEKTTIGECLQTIKKFTEVLSQYKIPPEQVRTVATAAVREAVNRDLFQARIFMETGIRIEIIEEMDVNWFLYLGIQPLLRKNPSFLKGNTFFVLVGGGMTQLFLLQDGYLSFSHTFRFGSFRMKEILEYLSTPDSWYKILLENQIFRMLSEIQRGTKIGKNNRMIVFGGDARFAAMRLTGKKPSGSEVVKIPLIKLEKMTEKILKKNKHKMVEDLSGRDWDPETMGPALLTYVHLVRSLSVKDLYVSSVTLRHGILYEPFFRKNLMGSFESQILYSSYQLGRKYVFDEPHARYVLQTSLALFNVLEASHPEAPRLKIILSVAALLHDIGNFIGSSSHHKHSAYLIQNERIFGLSSTEIKWIAMICRYHRKSIPSLKHPEYASLSQEERIVVSKLAALLRVADALDCNHNQRLVGLKIHTEEGRLVLASPHAEDIGLEKFALKKKSDLLEQIYGLQPVVIKGSMQ